MATIEDLVTTGSSDLTSSSIMLASTEISIKHRIKTQINFNYNSTHKKVVEDNP